MEAKEQKKRITIYLLIVAVVFCTLIGRLYYLQIIRNQQFVEKSHENRTRIVEVPARRGDILDASGRVLATSKLVFSIQLSPSLEGEQLKEVAERLSNIIGASDLGAEEIIEIVREHSRKYVPVEIIHMPQNSESWKIISEIEERRRQMPGVTIEERPQRFYAKESLAGHALGYVGKISETQLEENRKYNYDMQDRIGKSGVERSAELVKYDGNRIIGLRGKEGVKRIEVDANNRRIKELVTISPTPGDDVRLTIDIQLQRALEESMDSVIAEIQKENPKAMAGGAVVLDVNSGAVLAAASKPEINPNDFVDGSYAEKADYYNNTDKRPLFNRAFQATYPPGSTFKMITGMAALENGLDPTETIVCRGAYWNPPYIRCWNVHGRVNLYSAIAESCNTYFQEMGRRAGIDKIVQVAEQFGLGQKTGTLGILAEAQGLMPSPEWKRELNKERLQNKYEAEKKQLKERYEEELAKAESSKAREKIEEEYEQQKKLLESQYKIEDNFYTQWQPFDTYNTSIGQGSNSFTVIQLANYVATIANGGKRYRPYLIDEMVDNGSGKVVKDYGKKMINEVDVSAVNMAHIRRGMKGVTEPGGTAYFLFKDFPEDIGVGAKSGTSQTGRIGDVRDEDFHGIFVAFAPYENPEIAFAGVIEYGESGGGSAGRVAKAVFEEYFNLNQDKSSSSSQQ